MKRIGVWNTAFLGDSILTLPLLENLHAAYPHAAIDYYVRQGFAPLYEHHPAVANVVSVSKHKALQGISATVALGSMIREKQYDLWLSAHTSMRSGFMAKASQADRRIGYSESTLSSVWYTDIVSRQFDTREEIERLLLLLDPIGVPASVTWPHLILPQSAHDAADQFFSSLSGNVIGLHPGSVWATKRWPAEGFADVGIRALQEGIHVVIFAGPGEEDVAAEVYSTIAAGCSTQACNTFLHNVAGRLSLVELAAFINRLSCYVTNDSGPMHLAWVQHTPVTAIFGPTVRALGFYPRGESSTVLDVPLDCRPCGLHGHKQCPQGHHNCMRQVLASEVWTDVKMKLTRYMDEADLV